MLRERRGRLARPGKISLQRWVDRCIPLMPASSSNSRSMENRSMENHAGGGGGGVGKDPYMTHAVPGHTSVAS